MNQLILRNRQRFKTVRLPELRRLTRAVLEEGLGVDSYDLGIFLVGERVMTRLNREHLQHEGPTDVITFNYAPPAACPPPAAGPLHGEIFICIPVAVQQAREYHAPWQSELARYVIHGLLHLQGYDDMNVAGRRVMKARENRLLRRVTSRFPGLPLGP